MENLSLMIVTDDRAYGGALGHALQHLCRQIFIRIVGKKEMFVRKSSILDSADLLLWDGEEAERAYGGRIIMLSERPYMAVKNFTEKKFCIYRYSAARSILTSLFEIYGSLTGRRAFDIKGGRIRVLAFASCSGGSGCTTLSMAVAEELCRFRNMRTLYLSMEEMESTGEFMKCPAGIKGAGVYLYHLFKKGRPDEGSPMMESYTVRDDFGVEAFAPTDGRNPLRELTESEIDRFVSSIADSGRYDVMIIDLGSCASDTDMACIRLAERLCLVSSGGTEGTRESRYLKHLMYCCGEEALEKTIKVRNMSTGAEESGGDGMIETSAYIEKSDTFIQENDVKRIFLDGGFGSGIRTLTDKLMEISS